MSTRIDKQTTKLIARIAENLPADMSGDVMQGWIDNPKGLQKVLKEALCPPKWTIGENGVTYITLPATTGRTGEEWVTCFEKKGDRVSDYAKSVLRSKKFKPTTGVVNRIAVLPAKLWKDSERLTKRICKDAYAGTFTKENLTDPNAEVSCLIRDYLTDEEIEALGLWYIVGMHEPIEDSDGNPDLLSANRDDDGRRLDACYGGPGGQWGGLGGFAFSLSQVVPKV